MVILENEYTFNMLSSSSIDEIINDLNESYGKYTKSSYKKVSIKSKDDPNIQYRLLINSGSKKIYQIKEKIRYETLNQHKDMFIHVVVSEERKLDNKTIKAQLDDLNTSNTNTFDRYDWLSGSISLRISENARYLEYEVNSEEPDEAYDVFVNIYNIVYKRNYINTSIIQRGERLFIMAKREIRNPIPIQKNIKNVYNLYKKPFIVKPKTDGLHAILFNIQNNTYIWFMNDLPLVYKKTLSLNNDILEIEYIKETDTIFYIDNLSDRSEGYTMRYNRSKNRYSANIVFRPYVTFTNKKNIHERLEDIKRKEWYKKYPSDGLIIQSIGKYKSPESFIYKYKVGQDNTIDMILGDDAFYVSSGKSLVEFKGSNDIPFEFNPDLYKDDTKNVVAEWMYDVLDKKFVFIRERTDKIRPNALSTAVSNWDAIFMDMSLFFGNSSISRVSKIILDVKESLINKNASAYFDLGSGSAGPYRRYPKDRIIVFTEISEDLIRNARDRIEKDTSVENIAIEQLDYLDHKRLDAIWNKYMDICNHGIQITNFITITHQRRDQIKRLNDMWRYLLSKENVSKITMIIIDGAKMIDLKKRGILDNLGVYTENIEGDKYRTRIGHGTQATVDFIEYLYDKHYYFEKLDDIKVDVVPITEYIYQETDIITEYLTVDELKWLSIHYVVTLTSF